MSKETPSHDIDFNTPPIPAKGNAPEKEPFQKLFLDDFLCEIKSVRTCRKGKIKLTLELDDFEISPRREPIFGQVNEEGTVEDSLFGLLGYLAVKSPFLILSGQNVELTEPDKN